MTDRTLIRIDHLRQRVRLNGWHRLWVLATVLYALWQTYVVYNAIPSYAPIERQYALSTIESMRGMEKRIEGMTASEVREKYRGESFVYNEAHRELRDSRFALVAPQSNTRADVRRTPND